MSGDNVWISIVEPITNIPFFCFLPIGLVCVWCSSPTIWSSLAVPPTWRSLRTPSLLTCPGSPTSPVPPPLTSDVSHRLPCRFLGVILAVFGCLGPCWSFGVLRPGVGPGSSCIAPDRSVTAGVLVDCCGTLVCLDVLDAEWALARLDALAAAPSLPLTPRVLFPTRELLKLQKSGQFPDELVKIEGTQIHSVVH